MFHRFGGRPRQLLLGLAAAMLALSAVGPGFAQGAPSAPTMAVFTAGPDATGANTYIGRVEAPKAGQSVQGGSSLLVTGWAADTTAQGWAGFDQMQVYNGARDKNGTKVADGTVGQSRPDVADFLGPNFLKSGFSAVVPASTLPSGNQTLYVYLHTPNKGWWYKSVPVNQQASVALQFPTDPVVSWLRPNSGDIITNQQQGTVNNYLLEGFALDRNPQNNPNGVPKTNAPTGMANAGNVGISSITIYIDKLPGQPGFDSSVNQVPGTTFPSVAIGATSTPLNHNVIQDGCSVFGGPVTFCRSGISVTSNYGDNYTFAGWVKYIDQRTLQPDMFHTLYAVAVSSVTGKSSTATTTVFVKTLPNGAPGCATTQFLKHQCQYKAP